MNFINIGNGKLNVSEIGIGCMRMADITIEQAERVIKTSLENGINFFLTMQIYMAMENQKRYFQKQ